MGSYHHSSQECKDIVDIVYGEVQFHPELMVNLTSFNLNSLFYFCNVIADLEVYGKPMVWIGFYIAIASLFCILAMGADLFHGFRRRKIWFPCKYFSLNAASITVITVAMKLPVDLSSPMPSYMDQAAKMVSMAFMCTIMANLMPSLASMDNKTLLANVIGMDILVITMIVNICIEINTGVISEYKLPFPEDDYVFLFPRVAYLYVALMLFLLIILTSSAIVIPTYKKNLESKYQAISKATSNDQHPQHNEMFSVEKLRQQVRRYWVMAETGCPQFVMASTSFSSASTAICITALFFYIVVVYSLVYSFFNPHGLISYQSDYKWSVFAIVITQSIGIVVGSIAPIFRCFTIMSFKSFTTWDRNHLMVFKVEEYWTKKLYEWKETPIPFLSSGRGSKTLILQLKNLILSFCIGFQNAIVVLCKVIRLVPIVVLIFVRYCSYCWKSLKAMLCTTPIASSSGDMNKDLGNYVLQLEDDLELAERTLKRISNSMNRLIQKAEKEQHNNLLKLLEKSTGFEGVVKFDIDQVQPLLSIELVNSWSLPIVTLTCIAIALPNIHNDKVKSLFKSVGEGLFYTHLVEESLNSASEYVNIQKAATTLWHEVEDNCKWLENTLERSAYNGKTSLEILKWFADKAREIVTKIKRSANGEPMENFPHNLIAANSMYRITQTILLNYQSHIEPIREEDLFFLLYGMIADILVACFTNIPRVITIKCHESVIEKREASVEAATKLLGRTTKIINRLEACKPPSMDPDKMAFIDGWRLHLKQSIP